MNNIIQNLAVFRVQNFIDIIAVAIIVYILMLFIKDTRAQALAKGIVALILLQQISRLIGLYTLTYILGSAMQVGIIAVLVVFQPELRQALEQMGSVTQIKSLFTEENMNKSAIENTVSSICEVATYFSKQKVGSLIVLERNVRIGDIIRTGTTLNADVTPELLANIFTPNTPLHDGAVIIRSNKIIAAGALLPLTSNRNLDTELGTRHRAALGLSENSDSLVIVTSEETGKISIAINGGLTRNLTPSSLENSLFKMLSKPSQKPKLSKKEAPKNV